MLYRVLASIAWGLIVAGWTQRRSRRTHVPLALAGIGVDLALVLILEFQRDVIGLTFTKEFTGLQITHIASSAAAVVFYIPTVILGFKLMKDPGARGVRKAHHACAVLALFLRTIGFACMWSL